MATPACSHRPCGEDSSLVSFYTNAMSRNALGEEVFTGAASLLTALAQDERKRARLLTDSKECTMLVHNYGCALRFMTGGLVPQSRASESYRAYLSAVEACLAAGTGQPGLRVPAALALLKSQALECFARLITSDQKKVRTAERQHRQEQQGTDQQLGQDDASTSSPAPPALSDLRLCLYHSLDEAACLVGWIVDTMVLTNGKRSGCQCISCAGYAAHQRAQEEKRKQEQREKEQQKKHEEGRKNQERGKRGRQQRSRREGEEAQPDSASAQAPQQQQPLCLVSELWRALHDSQLPEAMVRGLLLLQDTLPRQGEPGEQGEGDGGASGGVAAAVRRAHADQLQLAGAARQAFGVRPDRGTLASNLAWMPQALPLPTSAHTERKRAVSVLARVGCQLMMSAGLVAAVAAAGGGTTYGLAPGPLVALAGDVLPELWACGEGSGGAAGSTDRLLTAVSKRLAQWVSIIGHSGFPELPVRLGGVLHAGRRHVKLLTAHARVATGQGRSGDPLGPSAQHQHHQQHNAPAAADTAVGAEAAARATAGKAAEGEAAAGQAAGAEAAGVVAARVEAAGVEEGQAAGSLGEAALGQADAGPSTPARGTWLNSVPRTTALVYAAKALELLSTIAQADLGMGALANGLNYPEEYRPVWWWEQLVELLPLMATTDLSAGRKLRWLPMLYQYAALPITKLDEQSTMLSEYPDSRLRGVRGVRGRRFRHGAL